MTEYDSGVPQERRAIDRQGHPAQTGGGGKSGGILQLLDRQVSDDYRREWTERIGTVNAAAAVTPESIMIFRIGEEWLALPAKTVREITRYKSVHSLPHRNGLVLGLVCVRNQLSICISLAALLGIDSSGTDSSKERQLIVVDWENNLLAFPVDFVHGIHRYHPDDLRQVPSTLAESAVVYTHGILPWSERAVGCLDQQLLFYTINRNLS